MSATSAVSPTSPLQQRDIRSASVPFKRDKDHGEKWSMGVRPLSGVRQVEFLTNDLVKGSESKRARVRPMKQYSEACSDRKVHANKTPRFTISLDYDQLNVASRHARKADPLLDTYDHAPPQLSNSLLEVLPPHTTAASRENFGDAGVLYSFDKDTSPQGREVHLGGLVEIAEKKWASKQTDRIVKSEYEVLDHEGEITVLASRKGKGKKGSPKQRAVDTAPAMVQTADDEDDGFELI